MKKKKKQTKKMKKKTTQKIKETEKKKPTTLTIGIRPSLKIRMSFFAMLIVGIRRTTTRWETRAPRILSKKRRKWLT